MGKKLFLSLFCLFVIAFVVGCSSSNSTNSDSTTPSQDTTQPNNTSQQPTTPTAPEKEELADELRVAFNAQPPTIDTHITTATVTRDVARHIFEPLLAANGAYEITPMLAESYEVNDEATKITFHLRKGVLFHNGKEMKAEDVVASMNRWVTTTTVGRVTFGDSKFEEVDEYTVVLNLEKPSGVALQVLINTNQFPAIMPKEVIEEADVDGVKEYIGTGPYKFNEWRQDQFIHLVKFDDYQPVDAPADGIAGKKEALIPNIYLEFVTDSSTRVAGIQSGQYDIGMLMPIDSFDQLEATPTVHTLTSFTGFNPLILNNKKGIFSNVKARQAVAAALDMDDIMMAAFGNPAFYRVDHGLMMVEQSDWYTEVGKENYNQKNPEKAKQLLQEAGYNGEKVRLMTSRDYDDFYNSAVAVQYQLEQIGMNVEVEVYDWATVIAKQPDENAWDFFITGFTSKTDPTQILFLDSRNEWAGWTNNPTIDSLLDQIRESSSQEHSKQLFEEVQKEFWETVPVIKLGDKYTLNAMNEKVENYQFFEGPIFWNVKKFK